MAPIRLWTDEQDAVLRELHGKGKSSAEIAAVIGGVTRNAVLGRAHRLKLPPHRHAPSRGQASERRRRRSREKFERGKKAKKPVFKAKESPEATPAPTVVLEPSPSQRRVYVGDTDFMSLERDQCRWPLGDRPFRFCGQRKWGDKAYCAHHCRIAYQPPQKREARAHERLASRTA